MLNKIETLDYVFALSASVVTFLLGQYDLPLKILIAAILLDFVSGSLKAIYFRKIDSSIGVKGIIKKVNILLCVMIAHLTDTITGTEIARNPIIFCFVANEFWSVAENSTQMGLKVPSILKDRLSQVNQGDTLDRNNTDHVSH